ncbi:hypothetical protein H7849_04295 [Alloacidobacterium dinghuense]|uniref:DUF3828 domain-containing protein n=1 Tax=Alloacidobacterium dinghuense TaxID=2763107 RepID=A0A7G8BKX8_9BACT|nr:hypothetical protein [Alloacidobacterium dinghuense]QNI33198.1 hypothetical protein H7849_04295 [Alloacidobacterium dinghuense]
MIKALMIGCSIFAATTAFGADQATVRVEPPNLQSPRPIEKQTEAAVIRDYLQAWQSFGTAFEQNQIDLLDRDFVGSAKDKLASTIQEQAKLGIHTRYQDRAHDLQIVFYSPEGLSIQLIDNVEYDVQVLDHDQVKTTQTVKTRYLAVLTPSEVRWRVRIFQSTPE